MFLYKRILPAVFILFPLLIVTAVMRTAPPHELPLAAFLPPIVITVFAFAMMRKLVWDLADEVWDGGDHLVIKRRGQTETVPLTNIMNVSASLLVNPPRITLRLVNPGNLGEEISFSPQRKLSFNPFARNAIADELIERVHRAKSGR